MNCLKGTLDDKSAAAGELVFERPPLTAGQKDTFTLRSLCLCGKILRILCELRALCERQERSSKLEEKKQAVFRLHPLIVTGG